METALTRLLGIEHPLIQAPMAGVSTPEMAAAASSAGALGSVALGALDADRGRAALTATRALTDRPIAANLFVHPTPVADPDRERAFLAALTPGFEQAGSEPPVRLEEIYRSFNDDDAMLQMLLDVRPSAVSLHFGTASENHTAALREAGIKVLACATSVPEALALEASGVDAVVLQGFSAGGHSGAFLGPPDPRTRGLEGLVDLVQRAAREVRVPLVAAGGLMRSADVRAVLEAGAAGAQLGTAFVSSPESLASEAYRQRLGTGSTRLTGHISGRPARGLDNGLMSWAEGVTAEPPDYPFTYDGVKQLVAATAEPDFSVMWAGEGCRSVQALPTAEIVQRLAADL